MVCPLGSPCEPGEAEVFPETPAFCGYFPVSNAALDGAHTGAAT